MFEFGVRAHDYGVGEPEKVFERISGDSLSTIQLAYKKSVEGIKSYFDITSQVIDRVNLSLAKNNLTVGVLGCYIEPSYVDEKLRRESVNEFIYQIDVAHANNAGCIGTETTAMEKQPNVDRKQALAALMKSLEEIMPIAENRGVTVAVEPVFYHTMNTPEITGQLIKELASPNLKVIFDPVNIFSPDCLSDQRALWDRAFESFGDKITAVHIKGIKIKDGKLQKSGLHDSVIDYQYIFDNLRKTNKFDKGLAVFREEAVPCEMQSDLALLKSL